MSKGSSCLILRSGQGDGAKHCQSPQPEEKQAGSREQTDLPAGTTLRPLLANHQHPNHELPRKPAQRTHEAVGIELHVAPRLFELLKAAGRGCSTGGSAASAGSRLAAVAEPSPLPAGLLPAVSSQAGALGHLCTLRSRQVIDCGINACSPALAKLVGDHLVAVAVAHQHRRLPILLCRQAGRQLRWHR